MEMLSLALLMTAVAILSLTLFMSSAVHTILRVGVRLCDRRRWWRGRANTRHARPKELNFAQKFEVFNQ